MSLQKDPVYRFAPLTQYTLYQRISIRLADIAFYTAIKLIGATIRYEVRGDDYLRSIESAGKLPIFVLWHDRIFLSTYFWRRHGIVVMTSKSFDGEYIARFIQRFGFGAIRGSSSRGGSKALVEMIRAIGRGLQVAFTLDGPRGPRYKAKLGPVILAKKTGNPIVPFVIEPKHFWKARSWDKMHLPRPFTKAVAILAEPIYVDANADDAQIDAKLSEVQHSLDRLVEEATKWRKGV